MWLIVESLFALCALGAGILVAADAYNARRCRYVDDHRPMKIIMKDCRRGLPECAGKVIQENCNE
jgi:hypothetical protein